MKHKGLNTDTLYNYILSISVKEPELLRKLREETERHKESYMMQIGPEQGQFLSFLIKLTGAKNTLDIGVFTGYSSLRVALSLPEDGRITACDICRKWTSIAQKYWKEGGVENKIDLRLGPARETLDNLISEGKKETFDFAFIDADKTNYDIYYEQCLKLIKQGGIIALDNVLWNGRVLDETTEEKTTIAIRKLNEKIYNDSRVTMTLVPIGDGMTLVMKM